MCGYEDVIRRYSG